MRSMTRIGSTVMALGLVVTLSGVATAQDVKIDYDKQVDFSRYKTFAAHVNATWASPFAEKRALEEIVKALTEKGWKQVEEPVAEAVVMINGSTQTKRDIN